ncbi:MAG: hypothetical protein FJX76_26380, partial [Armatimonadetes bacterium]|nr:hypothetical protein [Armatimonadota bacterium]
MSGFHAGALELYVPRNSMAHRWSARTRVLLVFAFLVAVAATRAVPTAWAVLAGILLGGCIAARLSPLLILQRALVALPFLVAAVPLAFVGPPGRYESICATTVLSVAAAAWLAATTRFPDLARAMAQLGVPRVLVSVAVMAWR